MEGGGLSEIVSDQQRILTLGILDNFGGMSVIFAWVNTSQNGWEIFGGSYMSLSMTPIDDRISSNKEPNDLLNSGGDARAQLAKTGCSDPSIECSDLCTAAWD